MTRPETHQNLIHPDKEQNRRLLTINVGGYVLVEEQNRHDPVTFPRVKAVFSDPSSVIRQTAEPAPIPMTGDQRKNSF
jgi:hypothetical protein